MTGPTNAHPVSTRHLMAVLARLVSAHISFEYAPSDLAGWHRITVERANWPRLELIAKEVAFSRLH